MLKCSFALIHITYFTVSKCTVQLLIVVVLSTMVKSEFKADFNDKTDIILGKFSIC